MVLSILWARSYKISNNLISTSKFHELPGVAALVMWEHRHQTNGPPWGEKDLCWGLAQKSWTCTLLNSHYSLGNVPRKELLECSSPGHYWAPMEAWCFGIRLLSQRVYVWKRTYPTILYPPLSPMRKVKLYWKSYRACLISYFSSLFLISWENTSYRYQNPNFVPFLVSKQKEDVSFWIQVANNRLYRLILKSEKHRSYCHST